jgi:hypothetical protein
MHSNAIAARRRAGTGILKIATAKNEQALKRSEWGRDLEAFHNAFADPLSFFSMLHSTVQ